MSIEKNVQIVKNFLAALGLRDQQGLLALSAEDIEWIIPGKDWPLAGTHRGHAGLENLLQKANETVETSYPEPPEFIAQGDRVVVVGLARGRIKATNRTFEDHWVFAITVRNGKLTNVREYHRPSPRRKEICGIGSTERFKARLSSLRRENGRGIRLATKS